MIGRNIWNFACEETVDGGFITRDTYSKPTHYETRDSLRNAVNEELEDWFVMMDADDEEAPDADASEAE